MSNQNDRDHVSRSLSIDVVSPHLMSDKRSYRCEIGPSGLYLKEATGLAVGTELEVIFSCPNGEPEPLRLSCLVEQNPGQNRKYLRFKGLDEHKRERLECVIWPPWDGEDLFDGVIILASCYGAETLKDCLRLTNILSNLPHGIKSHRRP